MLDIATVLVSMFTHIDDYCKLRTIVRPGQKPKVSDSEIITIALFSELAGKVSEYEQVRFVHQWLSDYFPRMVDRSQYHRRLRMLGRSINDIRVIILKQIPTSDMHIIDSTPVPVITFRRAHHTPLFPEAEYGYCAAKGLTYFGFKLHLVTDTQGIPVHFDLTSANVADIAMTEELLSYRSSKHSVLGDKGYLSKPLHNKLFDGYDITLYTPTRHNQKERESKEDRKLLGKWRQTIEVVNAMLKNMFHLERTFAKSLIGLAVKVMNKFTAMTFGIFLNSLYGRNLLDLESLVA